MQKGLLFILLWWISGTKAGFFAQAPLNYTTQGLVYSQNFDGLPNSGSFSLTGKGPHYLSSPPINGINLQGWQVFMIGGTNNNAGFLPGTGSSTASSIQSLGATNATDRALGSLSSGSGVYGMGLVMTNTSGVALNSITIRFTAEQWRKGGSGNKNSWAFRYKTGVFTTIDQVELLEDAHLNFSSPVNTTGAGSLNGNLPENQQTVAYTLLGINWRNGEQLLLRWDDADESGSDDACGIDNFSFSAEQVEDIPSIITRAATNISAHGAQLNFTVNENNARTSVLIEYDTSGNFISPGVVYPQPDILLAGTGTTTLIALLADLLPGTNYFYRIKAINNNGVTISPIQRFTTPVELPDISTVVTGSPGLTSAILGGTIRSDGGAAITEKGVQWSLNNAFQSSINKVTMGSGKTNFEQLVTGLPQGSVVYIRAYAINSSGIAYGNQMSATTQTTITGLSTTSNTTNASTVYFSLKTTQPITGLSPAAFTLITEGIDSATVTAISGTGTTFTISVNTGKGDGTIRLQLVNDTAIIPHIYNKPFLATNYCTIDKSVPQIRKISIPDQSMKSGDTVQVIISILPDFANIKMVTGSINGISILGFTKKNDSVCTAYFIIPNGSVDIPANAAIPVRLQLIDPTGNTSAVYEDPIVQENDPIDANRPLINRFKLMPNGIYKYGDTLFFYFGFSENTSVITTNGTPSFKITIGNTSRQVVYYSGSGSDSMIFVYVVQQTDEDSMGLKLSTSITLNNSIIKDMAGNNAQLSLPAPVPPYQIMIDAIPPKVNSVTVPVDKLYTINDTLSFIVNFTKKVILNNLSDIPLLKLTIGSSSKNAIYQKGAGSQNLVFRYIVQKNDLDKTGITIGSLMTNAANTITDAVGNAAVLSLKNIGSLSNVKIDAISPLFTVPDLETLFVCDYDSTIDITNALMVTDEEKGEALLWKIIPQQHKNDSSIIQATTPSTGSKVKPGNIQYTPSFQKSNTDTLLVLVTDGINDITKTVLVSLQTPISNNSIGISQYVCSSTTPTKIIGSIPMGGNQRYEYAWEFSGVTDSLNFVKASGSNTLKDYSPARLSTSSWFRRKVISGGCYHFSDTVKITVLKTGLWTGSFSTDWRNGKNWCDAIIPSGPIDIFIPSATAYNPIVADTASCRDLRVEQNGKITIKGSIAVSGNINAAPGTIDIQTGGLVLTGTVLQKIDAGYFESRTVKDLIINNAAGAFLSDTLLLSGSLQLVNGLLQTNNQLIMKPAAQVGPSAAGTFINGNITLLHLIPGGKRQFRLLGHPFADEIGLSMLIDSIDISGIGGSENGFRNTDTNNPSAFRYDALSGYDTLPIDTCWTAFTNTNGVAENAWKKHMGIRLLVRGKPGQGLDGALAGDGKNGTYLPEAVLLKLTGKVNTGDQELHLVKGKYSGYNLVANPYPSAIELSLASIGNGVGKNFWVWNTEQNITGGYSCIPFRSSYQLPAFGAIIVKATDSNNNTIVFTENCKVSKIQGLDLPFINNIEDHHLELRLARDSVFMDRIFIYHSDSAWHGFDQYDGEKFSNSEINFYSLSRDQKRLSVDVRPITSQTIIPLGLQVSAPGKFSITIVSAALPAPNVLYLHDKLMNKWVLLEKDSSYYFETTADTAGMSNNRFEISPKKELTDTSFTVEKITASINPVPASAEVIVKYNSIEAAYTIIRLINTAGIIVKSIIPGFQKKGTITIPISDLPLGVYFIEIRSGNNTISKKMIRN